MQEQISCAKAVHVNVDTTGNTPDFDKKTALHMEIWVTDANQARCKLEIARKDRETASALIVSDGSSVVMAARGKRLALPMPANLAVTLKSGLATAGADMVPGVLLSDPLALQKCLVASGFKLGVRDKVGMRETHVLHYVAKAKNSGPGTAVNITVWIDTQSNLPVKRVCAMDNGIRTEEVYSDWQLNATMDPALFELPK
jgi:outer membrane lipoprotein-sorting protein